MDKLSLVRWMHAGKHQKKMKLHCINKMQVETEEKRPGEGER